MLLRETRSGDLVEVMNLSALVNPFIEEVEVQFQCGEDLADMETRTKEDLAFPSGESLPECWKNGHYRHK